ncbi:MAG: transaldolase [Gammaproteobacteria bacterium]|nr:MAG: transaldolase [Gammaproteobacteria bacterium]
MDDTFSALAECGQFLWLDYIDRELLETGGLERLVSRGVTGVTTNPTIFHKAISSGERYDASVRHWLARHPNGSTESLLEYLMVEDVRVAADILRTVHDRSDGENGYVSIEVSPLLAHDEASTIEAVDRLFNAVGRPNVMVKIPATKAGLIAIEKALTQGYHVNVTLLFSTSRHADVLDAYRRAVSNQGTPAAVASVASFFVSRIDTKVDAVLAEIGTDAALALRGRIAIASATRAHRHLLTELDAPAFDVARDRGARIQRLLWGSTGTKNPDYSDVKYVEGLIGPHTVNTVPPDTLEAFVDHGRVSATLHDGVERAEADLATLAELGVDLGAITDELQTEGLAAFADSWREVLATLDDKRRALAD